MRGRIRSRDSQRLGEITELIALYPDAAANYVLRGELYAKNDEIELAEADFTKALALASKQMERDSWGLVAQAVQDRAEFGLKRIRRFGGRTTEAVSNSSGSSVPETENVSNNEPHSDEWGDVRGGADGEDRQSHD